MDKHFAISSTAKLCPIVGLTDCRATAGFLCVTCADNHEKLAAMALATELAVFNGEPLIIQLVFEPWTDKCKFF